MGMAGARVVTNNAAAAATFQRVRMPVMHFITYRGFREKDSPIGRNVQVVGQSQTAVVNNRIQRAIGFIGQLFNLALRGHAVQAHAADANNQIIVRIEGHAQGLTAYVRIDLHFLVVRRKEPHDVAMARTTVEVVVVVKDHILG